MPHTPNSVLAPNMLMLARIMRELIHKGSSPDMFSFLQFKILGIVCEEKNPSMRELAAHLCISSPSITEVINRLVKRDALKRTPDVKDRRIIRLSITPQGKKILKKGLKDITLKFHPLIDTLTEKEKEHFNTILTKLIANHN